MAITLKFPKEDMGWIPPTFYTLIGVMIGISTARSFAGGFNIQWFLAMGAIILITYLVVSFLKFEAKEK